MKKTLLIVGGILIILIIVGVWTYLVISGKTQAGEGIFSDFGFGDDAPEVMENRPAVVDTAPVDQGGAKQRLRQLTTRPVAGAVFVDGGIRYVEQGTGHIYDIMFSTGSEALVSGMTIARVVAAKFSPEGNRVALTSENNGQRETFVGTLTKNDSGEGMVEGISLPLNVREVSFSDTGENVYFLEETESGASGRAYDIVKETTRTLFSIPLRDVEVLWGEDTYVYTTPTALQNGYAYELDGDALNPLSDGAKGLMIIPYKEGVVLSESVERGVQSTALEDGASYTLPVGLFPEKCVDDAHATSTLFCAVMDLRQGVYPDSWYKGTVSMIDSLVRIDVTEHSATLVSDIYGETGRQIDVSSIGASGDGNYIYFINKNDGSLWIFDTTL